MIHPELLKQLGWSDELIARVTRDAPRVPTFPVAAEVKRKIRSRVVPGTQATSSATISPERPFDAASSTRRLVRVVVRRKRRAKS